jgi:hypothetical protein
MTFEKDTLGMIPVGFRASVKLIQGHQCLASRLITTAKKSPQDSSDMPPELVSHSFKSFPKAPDPLSCCGSGCANCVWIQYADDVSEYFSKKEHNSKAHKFLDKYKAVKDEMEKHIEDENLRAYLLMEVKAKLTKK